LALWAVEIWTIHTQVEDTARRRQHSRRSRQGCARDPHRSIRHVRPIARSWASHTSRPPALSPHVAN